ncbi:MAG: DUF4097 family beta strand repeat-containing protein [Gammaproteobacteria bacterium]
MKQVITKLGTMFAMVLVAASATGQSFQDVIIDEPTFRHFIPAPSAGEVSVVMEVGGLIVRGWSQNEIRVSGEFGDNPVHVELSQDEGRTRIHVVPKIQGSELVYRGNMNLVVNMPRQTNLIFSTTDADALITGVYGNQSLHSISGDIDTEIWQGSVIVESASGDLTISNLSGLGLSENYVESSDTSMVVLTTLSGDIEARGPFNQLAASTFSGDIDLDIVDVSTLDLDTSNGDIEVQASLNQGAEISAETINGDLEFDVGEGADLSLDLGSYSGRIENCYGHAPQQSSSDAGRGLNVVGSDEAPRLRVRTLNGDIELVCST